MNVRDTRHEKSKSRVSDGLVRFLSVTLFLSSFVVFSSEPGHAIPAFARKYGLPCSACHIGWPILNAFGQVFHDNGYQLGNERDSPIYQNPSFFPITFRVTPQWHVESLGKVPIDQPDGSQIEKTVNTTGFDLSGLDIWTAGTLYKNISFIVLPSMGEGDTFHFESAFVRFDNLFNTPWVNVKVGKFELDSLLSEKRFLVLNATGGSWFSYHFNPPNGTTQFGLGDNQIGLELSGHNKNSYSRYSIAVLNSADGNPGFTENGIGGVARDYDVYANVNQGFVIPGLGLQRFGAYGYFGKRPTFFLTTTTDSMTTPVQAAGAKSFSRVGAYAWWFIKNFDVETFYIHGSDNVFLGNAVPSNQPEALPAGAVGPTFNGGFIEAHYAYSPKLILTGRYEIDHMSRQANPTISPDAGNLSSWTIGARWYPIMFSRAGLAIAPEYSRATFPKSAPVSGTDVTNSSFFIGFDFDY
jgi:hypothetical protein